MKYLSFLVILLILFYPSLSFSQNLEKSISFIHTPQQLAEWLSKEFAYQLSIYDEWQTPQEMMQSRMGDCEDFATLSSSILRHLEIPHNILIIKFEDLKLKHAICIWKENNGFYSFISNQKLFRTRKRTIKEAIAKIYPDWERIIYTNPKKEYTKIVKKN